MSVLLRLENIQKSFYQGDQDVHVLQNIDLAIETGEIVALVGASGSGKTTLLQIAGLLDQPSSGHVFVDQTLSSGLNDEQRAAIRRTKMGFVYQFHHLLPELSALENVALPLLIAGKTQTFAYAKSKEMLDHLGLSHRFLHHPKKLSGGEQQRVAIARALIHEPKVLLADEPTGNLDHETAEIVFDIFLQIVRETKLCALIATHNMDLAKRMDRILTLHHGVIKNI